MGMAAGLGAAMYAVDEGGTAASPLRAAACAHARRWDAAFRSRPEEAPSEVLAWAAWGAAYDRDGDGRVTVDEFKQYYRRKGAARRLKRRGLRSDKAEALAFELLEQNDDDGSGFIDFAEWCSRWERDLPHGIDGDAIRSSLGTLRALYVRLSAEEGRVSRASLERFLAAGVPVLARALGSADVEAIRAAVEPRFLYDAPAFQTYGHRVVDGGRVKHTRGSDESSPITYNEFVTVMYYYALWGGMAGGGSEVGNANRLFRALEE